MARRLRVGVGRDRQLVAHARVIAKAFLMPAAIAPSIQRRPRWSQASFANQTRPTGRMMSS